MCILYSRRPPAHCDRDHVIALRNLRLRLPAFAVHPLVRTRVSLILVLKGAVGLLTSWRRGGIVLDDEESAPLTR